MKTIFVPKAPALIRARSLDSVRPRARFRDTMTTYDSATYDAAGAFLVGQLERLDQKLHDPLVSVTWTRDIDMRSDVTIEDEVSSFTNSSFASTGGFNAAGISWIGKDATEIQTLALDIGKTANPLNLWGQEVSFTMPELLSAQKLGRPVDQQKYNAMKLKHQMDADQLVYIGDSSVGTYGLFNSNLVTASNVAQAGATSPTGLTTSTKWVDKTPAMILADINNLLEATWAASGYAVIPSNLRLPPVQFAYLVNQIVSTAGNRSIMDYVKENNLLTASEGRALDIKPVKWLPGIGAGSTDRMVAYTKDEDRVRFPVVPLQRTPVEYRGIWQKTTYYGRFGAVEFVYPETVRYADGI